MKKTILRGRPNLSNPTEAYDSLEIGAIFKVFLKVVKPERAFYGATIIYGIALALLSLAAPISVQTLVSTVANTALAGPVIVLATVLLILLVVAGILNALQIYIMELFERKFFARITSEIVLQNIYAQTAYFKTINRAELVNRYFDIMTIQKNMPSLLIGGFSVILQAIVGLVVVSFYHPALFVFNMIFIVCVYIIWALWGHKSIYSALSFSSAKYNVARWLEELARNNADFKSHDRVLFALRKSENMTQSYMNHRRKFFKYTFRQTIGFLSMYAVFSAALLGLGGLLVIEGQLSLGQLVASELILTGVFFGLSRAGFYLNLLYEMVPAAEKISHFFRIPTETHGGKTFDPNGPFPVVLENAIVPYRGGKLRYHMNIPAGAKIMAGVSSSFMQEYFIDLVQGYMAPEQGLVKLDEQNIKDLNPHSYRDKVFVIDDNLLLEGTIEEYLHYANPQVSSVEVNDLLKSLQLDRVIDELPDGLQTEIIHTGYPLSASESLRLKLAAAMLTHPRVLIMTEIFDIMGRNIRRRVFSYLCGLDDLTLICFTNRQDSSHFKQYLYLSPDEDYLYDTLEELKAISLKIAEQEEDEYNASA